MKTVTLPDEVVRAVMHADTAMGLDMAVIGLRRAYVVATSTSPDDTDEWEDLDPSELPRF